MLAGWLLVLLAPSLFIEACKQFRCIYTMPKDGLTSREWAERLEKFAAGFFEFGRGQRPPKGSDRAKLVEKIEKCSRHRNTSLFDPFGKQILCKHVAITEIHLM